MTLCSRYLSLALVLVLFAPLMGCDPCKSLADKICECGASADEGSGEKDRCRKSLDLFSNMKGFSFASKSEMCQELLKDENCNCRAIHDGEFEKCGLAR